MKIFINRSKTKVFISDINTYKFLIGLIKSERFYYGTWFDIETDKVEELYKIPELEIEEYNGWDIQILNKLKEVEKIADWYSNPLANDSGGSKLCDEILKAVRPLIKELNNSII